MSTKVGIKELIEAGAHYGHQCRRWNPMMQRYIFGVRGGIHIIDLQKTVKLFQEATDFIEKVVARGGHVLFVGTKRQARDIIAEEAQRSGMYFINNRWLGGALTNYNTIRQSVGRLRKVEKMAQDGTYQKLTKKEVLNLERTKEGLSKNLGGIKDMPGLPQVIFITDSHKERIAIKEANKLGIPIVGILDTNADPRGVDFVIPGNDDSLKSLQLFTRAIADACLAGKLKQKQHGQVEARDEETKEGTIYDQEGHSVKVLKKKK